ncbi:MAG: L7Ae/L30e/S12e/Gadd45 family ribosomal protein [Acutalibacteraceae bacterium]|nr:ribosomal L7Ae/L30e/S12e/Gadd45 family protein [Clostridiales bacterium]
MEDKAINAVAGLLGIARRAGRLSTGFDAVCAQIGEGKAELVLLACDLSEKTGKELRYAARNRKLSAIRLPLDKETISRALGLKKPVGVLALTDKGFADAVRRQCRDEIEEVTAL